MFPDDLSALSASELYDLLNALTTYRKSDGRGRTPEAAHVREFCKGERERIRAELSGRGKPTSRPGDKRCYGPGQTAWQQAGG